MTDEVGGVRDHLANERTQLAWLRTGANVMVVGLAVARFADQGEVTVASLVGGGLLVAAGGLVVGYGTVRYRRLADELRRGHADSATSSAGPTLAAVLVLTAIVAATVLVLAST